MADRPKPISDAVKYVGSGVSALLGVVNALVVMGVISHEQAAQLDALGYAVNDATFPLADVATTTVGVVSGLVTLVAGVLASFGVAKTAESRVTPVEDPRNNDGQRLVATPVTPLGGSDTAIASSAGVLEPGAGK